MNSLTYPYAEETAQYPQVMNTVYPLDMDLFDDVGENVNALNALS